MDGLAIASLVVKGLGFVSKLDRDVKWAKHHNKDSFMDIIGIISRDASQSGILSTLGRLDAADAVASGKASAAQIQTLQLENLKLDRDFKLEQLRRLKGTGDCHSSGVCD